MLEPYWIGTEVVLTLYCGHDGRLVEPRRSKNSNDRLDSTRTTRDSETTGDRRYVLMDNTVKT